MNERENIIGLRGDNLQFARTGDTVMQFGQYLICDMDEKQFIIAHPSGECGVFSKDAFESHIAAFFGLHF
jgi:hypothetical protein